jgi:hypothetical protein
MADGGDGLVRGGEMPDNLQNPGVEANVFGSPPAGDDERIAGEELRCSPTWTGHQ